MVNKLDIHGVHVDLDDKLKAYATKKFGKLDRYVPRNRRESMHIEVFLKENKSKSNNKNTCEVNIKLPREQITTKESTMNMYAAIDIVETKLKNRLKKYKELHSHKAFRHKLLARIKRQP